MSKLKDVVAYIVKYYPYKGALSKARLTKMVYLADWRNAIVNGTQLTEIEWEFHNYGPFVFDVINMAQQEKIFRVDMGLNSYGDEKWTVSLADKNYVPKVTDEEAKILNHVISKTAPKVWDDFIKLVYSTYPIRTQPRRSKLDLPKLAKAYEKEKQRLELTR